MILLRVFRVPQLLVGRSILPVGVKHGTLHGQVTVCQGEDHDLGGADVDGNVAVMLQRGKMAFGADGGGDGIILVPDVDVLIPVQDADALELLFHVLPDQNGTGLLQEGMASFRC